MIGSCGGNAKTTTLFRVNAYMAVLGTVGTGTASVNDLYFRATAEYIAKKVPISREDRAASNPDSPIYDYKKNNPTTEFDVRHANNFTHSIKQYILPHKNTGNAFYTKYTALTGDMTYRADADQE